jgi:hypothetical protein
LRRQANRVHQGASLQRVAGMDDYRLVGFEPAQHLNLCAKIASQLHCSVLHAVLSSVRKMAVRFGSGRQRLIFQVESPVCLPSDFLPEQLANVFFDDHVLIGRERWSTRFFAQTVSIDSLHAPGSQPLQQKVTYGDSHFKVLCLRKTRAASLNAHSTSIIGDPMLLDLEIVDEKKPRPRDEVSIAARPDKGCTISFSRLVFDRLHVAGPIRHEFAVTLFGPVI